MAKILIRALLTAEDEIIAMILAHEGSIFTNDPADAGGPTRWGITQAVLANWRGRPVSIDEVRNLTRDEAEAIYRSLYIRPFDILPQSPLRVNVIDMGVNAGIRRAAMLLQQMVGASVDGWIGGETLRKLQAMPYIHLDLNIMYAGFRLSFYEDLIISKPVNIKWRGGWRNRALSFVQKKPLAYPRTVQQYGIFGKMGKAA